MQVSGRANAARGSRRRHDVDDSAQLVVGVRVGGGSKLAQAEQLLDPSEAGAADSTGQNGDLRIAGQPPGAHHQTRWLRVTLDTPG